ncbi:PDZ domain-containing protein [Tautonia rosea]|uniref:PDZ domain-containing protein n=1 Tax=Tautonia rosea TaxID=2728037 RepID=UPI001472E912|nr:PDZ domain-containing protein [Tautonia rosea]
MNLPRSRSSRLIGVAGLILAATLAPAGTTEVDAQQPGRALIQPAPVQPAPVQPAPTQAAPYYAPPPTNLYASNLGIYYRLEPYGNAQGARLTHYPVAGSPASQIQLEPGDMITALDGQPIYGPNDLLNHSAQTSVQFVNIRTGQPQVNWVFIPTVNPGPVPGPFPQPVPPGFGQLPYTLGVATQLTAVSNNNQVYAAPVPGQPAPRVTLRPTYGLRVTQVVPGGAAQRSGLELGDTIMSANGIPMSDSNALRRVIASSGGALNLIVRDVRNPGVDVPVYVQLDPSGGQVYASPAPPQVPATAPAPAPIPAPTPTPIPIPLPLPVPNPTP